MTKSIRWTEEQLSKYLAEQGVKAVIAAMDSTPVAKPTKYKNVKTGKNASGKEARRAAELRLMEKAGKINNLKEQVKFELIPSQRIDGKVVERACSYVADFTYYDPHNFVCEDCKGFRTPVYRIKKKLLLQVHGIRIKET